MRELAKSSLGSACVTGLALTIVASASAMDAAQRSFVHESSASRQVFYEAIADGGTGAAKHDEDLVASELPVWLPRGHQSDVSDFLASVPGADVLVSQLKSQIRRVFGDDAVIATELVADAHDGTKQAFVVVATSLELDEGDRLLRQLEDEWWLEAMPANASVALELKFV